MNSVVREVQADNYGESMPARQSQQTVEEYGVNWLNPNRAFVEYTAEMAFDLIGLYPGAPRDAIFNRLPDCVAKLKLSPAAKLVYADIFSWVFYTQTPREYFYGHRKMAARTGLTRQAVCSAVRELIAAELISEQTAHTSARKRAGLVPLNFSGVFKDVAENDVETAAVEAPAKPKPKVDCDELDFDGIDETPVPTLADTTVEPGKPMPFAVARRLRWLPIYLRMYLVRAAGLVETTDVILYGLLAKLAQPFVFASKSRLAAATGITRKTVTRCLRRLVRFRMIAQADHGYYIVAHPVLLGGKASAHLANQLVKLVHEHEARERERLAEAAKPRDYGEL